LNTYQYHKDMFHITKW